MQLWVARVFGTAASQMLLVAIGWHMYDITHSAWDLGLVGLVQSIPISATSAQSFLMESEASSSAGNRAEQSKF